LHEKRPDVPTEWLLCLRWLRRGTVDVVARSEATVDGSGDVTLFEALVERPFSAGVMRCTLSKLGEAGAWLVSGLQVRIASDFLPSGPLTTWHDTEPFGDEPEPEPEPEGEGEEAE